MFTGFRLFKVYVKQIVHILKSCQHSHIIYQKYINLGGSAASGGGSAASGAAVRGRGRDRLAGRPRPSAERLMRGSDL